MLRGYEDFIVDECERLAGERYHTEFEELPDQIQQQLWSEAEQSVPNAEAEAAELAVDRQQDAAAEQEIS